MNIKLDQRKAISKVLLDIIISDDEVHEGEISCLGEIQEQLGITTKEIDESRDMDHLECLKHICDLSREDKNTVAKWMKEMVGSDGHIDEVEMIALKSVCEAIGVAVPE